MNKTREQSKKAKEKPRSMRHFICLRHPYRYKMEEERCAIRAVLHFGGKNDKTDDNVTLLRLTVDGTGWTGYEASHLFRACIGEIIESESRLDF